MPPLAAEEKHHPSTLEDTIEHCIGEFGWTQLLQATIVSFAGFFDAQQTFISVFTDAEPKWNCINTNHSSCTITSNVCQLSDDSWSWESPASASIISEWSLQCAGAIVKGLPASSFFFGCLVGGFALAALADSAMGRKNLLIFTTLMMSIAGVLTSASSNIWMYAGLRFFSGFFRATVGTCSLVLSTELVGKKWREKVGIMAFFYFTLGFLSLPLIAFLLRSSSWRLIYLWTCVPAAFYSLMAFFLVRESPRWLFIKGRKQEFAETLRSIAAPPKRSSLTQSFFSNCTEWDEKLLEISETGNVFSALTMMLKKGWSLRRLAAVAGVGLGLGTIYYGMPLGLESLSFNNLYLSVTLNALSDLPASVMALLLIGKLNRKSCVVGLSLLSGICSVSCVVVKWKGMQMVLEVASFFSTCTALAFVMIYTLELFPTCVRNSAVSIVRQALVLGGTVSPVLAAAGRNNGWLSYGVFGVMSSVCGLFVLSLPETRGRVLCDTMEEQERRDAALI